MYFKAVLLVCAQALVIQSISAQYLGAYGACDGFAYDGYARGAPYIGGFYGYSPAALAASNGPGLFVTSSSPILPTGISVLSENVFEGVLTAVGAMPFVGTVSLEGVLPSAGAGLIDYDCGDGAVGIVAEEPAAYDYDDIPGPLAYGAGYAGIAEPFEYGYGIADLLGYGAGYGGIAEPFGCGYGMPEPFAYGAGYAGIDDPFGYGYDIVEPFAYGAGYARFADPFGCGYGMPEPFAYGAGYGGIADPFGYGYDIAEPFAYGAGYAGIADPFGYGYDIADPFAYGAGYGYRGFY